MHRLGWKVVDVCRLISIHNNPENLQVPKGFQQLKMTVADVHTQDITPYFNPSYDFIEEARNNNQGNTSRRQLIAQECSYLPILQ